MRALAFTFIVALDLLIGAALLFAVAIVVTGGWTFDVWTHEVRAHHVGSLLLVSLSLGFGRFLISRVPVLGVIPPDTLENGAISVIKSVRDRMTRVNLHRATLVAIAIALVSFGLKAYSASTHVGFLTGDDVEVHQMTFARLFGLGWPAWDVRSAFYPMTFVYPVQWFLHQLGVNDPWPLILSGRLMVALLSTVSVFLLFRVLHKPYGAPVALLSAALFGISKLQLIYGASELPRPVASLFLVMAFGLLGNRRLSHAMWGGSLIGVAAAFRFSEIFFLVPALIQLLLQRRIRDSVVMLAAGAMTAATIQGVSDYLYWGAPFTSLQQIVDYTLVQRQSSRGFEPLWFYLTSTPDWTDIVLFGLMLFGSTVAGMRAVVWAWVPVLILSLLPHKEPRYLVPVMPFLALLAAQGMWRVVGLLTERSKGTQWIKTPGLVIAGGLLGVVLTNVTAVHFARSDSEVRLARTLSVLPAVRGIAGDQLWRLGGPLYFMKLSAVVDLDPSRIGDAAYLRQSVGGDVQIIVLDAQNAADHSPDATLRDMGFARVRLPAEGAGGMAVFSRVGEID